MTLHFAYGSNMSPKLMRRHAPGARPLGAARLAGFCFTITGDGYASVEPARGETVHGVVWRLTARDRVTLDTWENIAAGLYRCEMLPVFMDGRRMPALVYLARPKGEGRPRPGYMELVVAAAREWDLPDDYVLSLEDWLPPRPSAAGPRKLGEFL